MPVIREPLNPEDSFRNPPGSRSMTATEWPESSRIWAMVEPTRPHPMMTMCTLFLPPGRCLITVCVPGACRQPGGTPPAPAAKGNGTMVPVTTPAPARPSPGDVLELTAGEAAHGGWCVARAGDQGSLVLFVRHALPGERVRAVITQVTAKLARADAVEILDASPDRVTPPCPHARPGGCGGCDWQHASLPAQRQLKAAVIRQQLARIAGLEREVTV